MLWIKIFLVRSVIQLKTSMSICDNSISFDPYKHHFHQGKEISQWLINTLVYKCTCWIFVTTVKETEVQLCSSSAKLTTSEIIHPQKVYKSSVEKSANLTPFIFPYFESHLNWRRQITDGQMEAVKVPFCWLKITVKWEY